MLSRIISDGLHVRRLVQAGMPVRKIATRSLRGVGGTVDPGIERGISLASSGSSTYVPNCASSLGLGGVEAVLLARAG